MLVEILFLITPVLFAGLTFIFFLKAKGKYWLNYPLDFGIKFNGKRLFGKNKTIKGPLFMGVFTMLYGSITYEVLRNSLHIQLSNQQTLAYFFLVGLAYSLGELPNSFIKRQLSILPGGRHGNQILRAVFSLADIFDSLIAVGVVSFILFHLPVGTVTIAVLTGGFIHLLTDFLMLSLGLKGKISRQDVN